MHWGTPVCTLTLWLTASSMCARARNSLASSHPAIASWDDEWFAAASMGMTAQRLRAAGGVGGRPGAIMVPPILPSTVNCRLARS